MVKKKLEELKKPSAIKNIIKDEVQITNPQIVLCVLMLLLSNNQEFGVCL